MKEKERTKVVVDETTVYEIDLDCCECMEDVREEQEEEMSVILGKSSNQRH